MNTWSAADWAGIIGACAWLPIIVSFIKYLTTKPKLNIILHKEAEIGYTTLGPVFNISMALSAENAECLVDEILIELYGPNREHYVFVWDWFEERFYDIEYSEIGLTPVTKRQNAVAIKVSKEGIAEKKIGYHEKVFKQNYKLLLAKSNEAYANIANNQQDANVLRASKEFNDLKNLLLGSMMWKPGMYDAIVKVRILKMDKLFTKNFRFELSTLEVRKVQNNVKICEEILDSHYFPKDDPITFTWNWVNPLIIG